MNKRASRNRGQEEKVGTPLVQVPVWPVPILSVGSSRGGVIMMIRRRRRRKQILLIIITIIIIVVLLLIIIIVTIIVITILLIRGLALQLEPQRPAQRKLLELAPAK